MTGLAFLSAAVWVWLLFMRGGFWRADQRLDPPEGASADAPAVVAVIPARDEAPTVGRTVASLLAQDYGGRVDVVVVDDNSTDGTAEAARAGAGDAADRLHVVRGKPLETGWSGKLWAVNQGIDRAREVAPGADFLLLTDADIEHDPANVAALVAKARSDGLDLVSLMVRLNCQTAWERLLVPAFVFFFQKLYPFPWVNDRRRATAAAAGGCMLVRRRALEDAGGIARIKDRLIDDCALAALLKRPGDDRGGGIWLGLGERTRSLRRYDSLGEIWRMVARTAFVQLDRSALNLLGTVLGMVVIYLTPPLAAGWGLAAGDPPLAALGLIAWLFMSAAYLPTLGYFARPAPASLLLPLAALLYTLMTVDSARRHWAGRGGGWKGRTYGSAAGGSDGAGGDGG